MYQQPIMENPCSLPADSDSPRSIAYSPFIREEPTKEAVVSTGKGAKILVPRHQTIDAQHVDLLFAAAASQRVVPAFEGAALSFGNDNVPRARQLRYALVVPRLVAPHPYRQIDIPIGPVEAVAMLAQGRFRALNSMCGFGTRTGARTLAEIGDPHRFANPGRLAAYASLAPVDRQSGRSHRTRRPRGSLHGGGRVVHSPRSLCRVTQVDDLCRQPAIAREPNCHRHPTERIGDHGTAAVGSQSPHCACIQECCLGQACRPDTSPC